MKLYTSKTPSVFPKIFSKYRWHFHSEDPALYLTFDDGPTPEVTTFVLDQLSEYNAKATFFCIGKNVVQQPEIYQRILAEGHTVGNHTHNHLKGWKKSVDTYVENTEKARKHIASPLFRPPYGKIKKKQAKALLKKGYEIVMWDVLSADFDTDISKEKCLSNVLDHAKKGSIVVFHDSIKAQENVVYALPKVLAFFAEKGYSFKGIPT
jgi:peptidoglycan/xylan/chitin deacetylase (PgdA/CDA1 family)